MKEKYFAAFCAGVLVTISIQLTAVEKADKGDHKITIEELVKKVKLATDADGITQNSTTKIQKGVVEMPEQNFKVETVVSYSYPDKCRLVSKFPDGKEDIQIVNGDKAWEIKDGKTRKITGEELNYLIFNTRLDSFRSNWKKLFGKVTLEHDTVVKGHDCYVVRCQPASEFNLNTDVVFYINKHSFFVERTDMSAYSQAGILRENIVVEKYEKIGGIMVPVDTQTDIMGAIIKYKVVDVKYNKNIDASVFEVPEDLMN